MTSAEVRVDSPHFLADSFYSKKNKAMDSYLSGLVPKPGLALVHTNYELNNGFFRDSEYVILSEVASAN